MNQIIIYQGGAGEREMFGTPVAVQSTPSEPFLSYCLCLVECRAVTGSILKLDQFIMC